MYMDTSFVAVQEIGINEIPSWSTLHPELTWNSLILEGQFGPTFACVALDYLLTQQGVNQVWMANSGVGPKKVFVKSLRNLPRSILCD